MNKVIARINEIADACEVDKEIVESAVRFFESLGDVEALGIFVCVMEDGGLQVELTRFPRHLEVSFEDSSNILVLKEDREEIYFSTFNLNVENLGLGRELVEWLRNRTNGGNYDTFQGAG